MIVFIFLWLIFIGIGARYGGLASAAAGGALDHWRGSPHGRLALILLLDQMPRVIHRGTAAAFAQDEAAREVAERGLASGGDRLLRPIERVFFYLPFEHSESLTDQERSVELYRELAASVPDAWRETFDGFLDYAERHREVIERFPGSIEAQEKLVLFLRTASDREQLQEALVGLALARKAVGDNGKSKPSFAPWPGAGFNWWRTSVWMVSRPLQKKQLLLQ